MKKLSIILLVLGVVILAVLLAKDSIIKASVEKGVESATGLKLAIGSLHVGILKPIVDIKNLRLFNPPEFPDRTMIDIPEIYVRYDLPALIRGKMHLQEVRLALKELVVLKNAQGKLNLKTLKSVQAQKEATPASQKTSGKAAPQVKIDSLALSIGKVTYKDYSKGNTPEVQEFNINFNERYSNVDNPYALVNLIIVKALTNTSIASLVNFDLKGLQGAAGGVFSGAQESVTSAESRAQEAGKQTADTIKGLFKDPFGSN